MRKSHIKGYQKKFKKYGVDVRSLQWTSREAQERRFKILVSEIDFEGYRPIGPMARRGKSILDVGCGFGDIIPFIKKRAEKFTYTGVDVVSEFVEEAKKKFPDYEFFVNDYFDNPLKQKFDIVLTSGTLNANIKNPYVYRFDAIKVMFTHAKELVAFNMAGGEPQPKNKRFYRVYYADLNKVVAFCKNLSKNIKVKSDYSSRDFTVLLYK